MQQTFFYGRVSDIGQNLARQEDAARECRYDIARCFFDKITGASSSRPNLDAMIDRLRPHDTVVCLDMTRLGRSVEDLFYLLRVITQEKKCTVIFLKEGLTLTDDNSPIAEFVKHMFAALAQLSRDNIKDAQREGIRAAKARGQRFGPPPLDVEKIKNYYRFRDEGYSIVKAALNAGISRSSAKRYEKTR